MLLKPLFSFFDMIREESSPLQVSFAILLGFFLAISPPLSPQTAFAFLVLCIVRMNLLAVTLSYFFFYTAFLPLESPLHAIGRFILVDSPSLRRLFAGLYHAPVFVFTGYNNTVTLGSLVLFILSAIPVLIISYFLYRSWAPKVFLTIQQSNLFLTLRASLIFRRYADYITKKKN